MDCQHWHIFLVFALFSFSIVFTTISLYRSVDTCCSTICATIGVIGTTVGSFLFFVFVIWWWLNDVPQLLMFSYLLFPYFTVIDILISRYQYLTFMRPYRPRQLTPTHVDCGLRQCCTRGPDFIPPAVVRLCASLSALCQQPEAAADGQEQAQGQGQGDRNMKLVAAQAISKLCKMLGEGIDGGDANVRVDAGVRITSFQTY
jgi:hypothetical protein